MSTVEQEPTEPKEGLALADLPNPSMSAGPGSAHGTPVAPKQRVYFYSPGEWEEFILEWVTALTPKYHQVKRVGGTNDAGADIAAFKSVKGFEGPWDCFQCKHYSNVLYPSDAYPEILKVLRHTDEGRYQLPDRYVFASPKGCGPTLSRLLSTPTALRSSFLEKFDGDPTLTTGLTPESVKRIRSLATETDFALFESVELHELLETHRTTPYYIVRFGEALAPRPQAEEPPAEIAAGETRYVQQLVDVYEDQYPGGTFAPDCLQHHESVGTHFRRQRYRFYSSEALKAYARDAVPPGTFEALQDEIYSAVVDIVEDPSLRPLQRLTQALSSAAAADLSAHPLVSVSAVRDRQGICHQLANEDRLTWCHGESAT